MHEGKLELQLRLEYDPHIQSETALFLDDVRARFIEDKGMHWLTIVTLAFLALMLISIAAIFVYLFWDA